MCSVSFLIYPEFSVLTMNRDEARNRAELGRLVHAKDPALSVYPQDARAGGTWFGANRFGVAMTLLNRYQDPQRSSDVISRGHIIPKLLAFNSIAAIRDAIEHHHALELTRFNPFDLVIAQRHGAHQLSWNGVHARWQSFAHTLFVSSSAVSTDHVIAHRKQVFEQWLSSKHDTHHLPTEAANVLLEVHLARHDDTNIAIRMERAHSHSKSICQLRFDGSGHDLSYWNEQSISSCDPKVPYQTAEHFRWQ